MGWLGMKSLLDAIEMANTTEPAAIVQALESWKYKRGDIEVRRRCTLRGVGGIPDVHHQRSRHAVRRWWFAAGAVDEFDCHAPD